MIGRKPAKNPKNLLVKARLDYKTAMQLENCCEKLNLSKSELIRYLIDKVSKELYYMDWEKGVAAYRLTDPDLRKTRAKRYLERIDHINLLPKGMSLRNEANEKVPGDDGWTILQQF